MFKKHLNFFSLAENLKELPTSSTHPYPPYFIGDWIKTGMLQWAHSIVTDSGAVMGAGLSEIFVDVDLGRD